MIGRYGASVGQIHRGKAGAYNVALVKTIPDISLLNQDYFYYFLTSDLFQEPLAAKKSRGAQDGFNQEDIAPFAVPLPPLEEQQRIVAILDEAFEGLDRARANAEANLQSARELFDSYVAHRFAGISEWPTYPISEFGEVFDGPHATPKTIDSGPLFLGISSLVDGRIELTKTRHLTESDFKNWTKRVIPKPGDVVFSYETRLGQVGLIPEGMRCCLGRRMGLVRVNRAKIKPEYFVAYYLSPQFQAVIKEKTILGATVDRISIKDFPDFPFVVPDIQSQTEILEDIEAFRESQDALVAAATTKLKDLDDLRQTLLQKAFAGELT